MNTERENTINSLTRYATDIDPEKVVKNPEAEDEVPSDKFTVGNSGRVYRNMPHLLSPTPLNICYF